MDLTVLIITKNSADTLEATLKSLVEWAKTILIVDNYSTDSTCAIAYKYGCNVIHSAEEGFSVQRTFALSLVKTKWTLVLDCDEVLTNENKKEIEAVIVQEKISGYRLQFRNHLFGKKLMYGELHEKLVLFQTKKAALTQREVHETYVVKGKIGILKTEVDHYSYQSISQLFSKFTAYAILDAKEFKKNKKKYGIKEIILNPLHMFFSRFIKDGGYKDGPIRLILDVAFGYMEFLSYAAIPFVKVKKRISIDCGQYAVGETVKSGIDRLIQGILNHKSENHQYYWFSFNKNVKNSLPSRFFSQFWLPLQTIVKRCDIFLGVAGNIPSILRFFSIQKILFLYDFGFFLSAEKYMSSSGKLQSQTVSSIKIADKIIFLHAEIYKQFVELFPEYCYKAMIIPSGADHLEQLTEEPLSIQNKKQIILYVGVVKPVKRVEIILSVIGNGYCIIAGPQEKEYIKTLRIKETQNIQFIQNFTDSQLKWLYKKADVMVYTSEQEGFCYPVLEALTLGLPVIALTLPVFVEYKKYFHHLILVRDEKEMKTLLNKNNFKKENTFIDHPYRWSIFSQMLKKRVGPNWQPQRLPNAGAGVAFIVVLYKTSNEERARLEKEINALGLENYHIYWIDNSNNGKGYAAGVNEGIRKGLLDNCELFFTLNPDISFCHMTKSGLLSVSEKCDVWGYAMKQRGKIYYGGEIDKWRLSGGLVTNKPDKRYKTADFISGSLMGFTKEVVQTIGFWDESYFMYYEDVDYCIRAQKKGLIVGLDSETGYEHLEVSQYNTEKANWMAKSRWMFFWKYANTKQKLREILRLPKTLLNT